jgi:hypothetical protein
LTERKTNTAEVKKKADKEHLPDNLKYSKWDHIEVSDESCHGSVNSEL